ncbi:glycosyltransferase family 4 protein [Xanthomarina sp. GH4-25]|uniref:glycosyltransferase family 4 protein n=1 Tax=Xanthomarina sp. GH4-25 TaxID=3349335 RepID=UPI00387806FA
MKNQLKIAIYSGVSKSTTFIERLIDGIANQKIEVLIFGKNTGKPNPSKYIKYHTYGNKINKSLRLFKYTILLSLFNRSDKKKLDRFIASNRGSRFMLQLKYYPVLYYKPDIFHLQWVKSLADWIWVQDFGMKLIVSLRGTHITISPKADSVLDEQYLKLFPQVNLFHAVSQSIAKETIKYGVSESKIKVVKSGLPLEALKYVPKDSVNKHLNIVSIGRPHFAKGYQYALDAMFLLKKKNLNFHYTIIGIETDEPLLFQQKKLELEQHVTFVKPLEFEAVIEKLKTADVLLLPSIEEGIANVVLEAMALGTLVISTDCGGMNEVVDHAESGFLIPVRDVDAMADRIFEVSEMTLDRYHVMTKKARIKIEENHSEKYMISSFLNIYRDIVKGII